MEITTLNAAADLYLYSDMLPNKTDYESVKFYIEQRIKDYESCLGKCRSIQMCGQTIYYPTASIEITLVLVIDHLKKQLLKLKQEENNNGTFQETPRI